MAAFRNPAARDRAFGRHYAKRGTAVVVTKSTRAPYAAERLSAWAAKYHALPVSARNRENG